MPNFGSHLSGPIRHTTRYRDQSDRAWFRDLPVGMNDPDFVNFFADFTLANDYNTTDWTFSSSGTAGVSAAVATTTNAVNGSLLLSVGSTAGNFAAPQIKETSWLLDPTVPTAGQIQDSKRLWFEARFQASSVTDQGIFIGLSEIATGVLNVVSANYIGFQVNPGSATLTMVNSTASSIASFSAQQGGSGNSVTLAANTFYTVGFVFNNSNSVDFYVNRNFMGTATTKLPTSPLSVMLQTNINATAVNRTLSVDYVYVCKNR